MTLLVNELATSKRDSAATTQLHRKIEEQAEHIKVLKEINFEVMVERARQADTARKMQKSIDDAKNETKVMQKSVEDAKIEADAMKKSAAAAKNETEAMKTRLEGMRKVYNELIRDTHFEKDKRVQAEQTLRDYLAAHKAVAEKFGSRMV